MKAIFAERRCARMPRGSIRRRRRTFNNLQVGTAARPVTIFHPRSFLFLSQGLAA